MTSTEHGGQGRQSGAQFGKYLIVRRLGSGAFGSVYEALLSGPMGFEKRVGIKRLHRHLIEADEQFAQTLVNEARLGGMLHHPNIVDVLEFNRFEGDYYIAMEFVDGATLEELLRLCSRRGARLPRFAILDICKQICRGLEFAHTLSDGTGRPLNIIHRDIKPSNVMIDRAGVVKICDFGIAKAASHVFGQSSTGVAKGSPRYMSPDVLRGLRPLRPRSDLFSLGALLFEVTLGRPLFVADNMLQLANLIVQGDLTDDIAAGEAAFPGFGPILERLLEQEPENRFQSAREVREALRPLELRYPPEADLADVVARVLPKLDRTERIEVASLDDLLTQSVRSDRPLSETDWVVPARPLPKQPSDDPEAPGAGDWGSFTAAFASDGTSRAGMGSLASSEENESLFGARSEAEEPAATRPMAPATLPPAPRSRRRFPTALWLLLPALIAATAWAIGGSAGKPHAEAPDEQMTPAVELTPAMSASPERTAPETPSVGAAPDSGAAGPDRTGTDEDRSSPDRPIDSKRSKPPPRSASSLSEQASRRSPRRVRRAPAAASTPLAREAASPASTSAQREAPQPSPAATRPAPSSEPGVADRSGGGKDAADEVPVAASSASDSRPPSEAAAKKPGELSIRFQIEPDGALVFLDGQALANGRRVYRLRPRPLQPGRHRLVVKSGAGLSWETQLDVDGQRFTFECDFGRERACVRVGAP